MASISIKQVPQGVQNQWQYKNQFEFTTSEMLFVERKMSWTPAHVKLLLLTKCKKSEKAIFEEPYEGKLFFEWSSTLGLKFASFFVDFTLSWSETPLKEWNNLHSF